ncbi:hypothetical protein IAT40_001760 [Kwoniella sp. CBS 6097]
MNSAVSSRASPDLGGSSDSGGYNTKEFEDKYGFNPYHGRKRKAQSVPSAVSLPALSGTEQSALTPSTVGAGSTKGPPPASRNLVHASQYDDPIANAPASRRWYPDGGASAYSDNGSLSLPPSSAAGLSAVSGSAYGGSSGAPYSMETDAASTEGDPAICPYPPSSMAPSAW